MGQGTLMATRVLLELSAGDVLACNSDTGSFTLIRNSDGTVVDLNALVPNVTEGSRAMGMLRMNPITFSHICSVLTALQGLSTGGQVEFSGPVFTCTVSQPEPRTESEQAAYEAACYTPYERAALHRRDGNLIQLDTTGLYVLVAEDGTTLLPGGEGEWVFTHEDALVAQAEYGMGELRYTPIPGDAVWYLARSGGQPRGTLLYQFELQLQYPRSDEAFRFVCLENQHTSGLVQSGYLKGTSRIMLDLRAMSTEGTDLWTWLVEQMRLAEQAGQPT